ncbi:MAG: LamG domain-containing protein, partial [Pseudonocardiales bacterium]
MAKVKRAVATIAGVGLAGYGLLLPVTAAGADTAPVAGTPATVSADPLATWQINGVVWSQAVVGNTVYATGSFTQARPPGSPLGSNEVARSNLLAYDITTGNLITSFNHSLNAQGLRVVASPDGSRVYVGGDFTQVDGITRNHVAAFVTATGALDTSFTPSVSNQVRAIAVSASTVYLGGSFSYVNGLRRTRLAAVSTAGALSTTWTPSADDETVYAMVLAPGGSRVIIGGRFSSVNGQSGNVAVAALDAGSGALGTWNYHPYQAASGGSYSYVTDLTTDGTTIFAANDGEGGNYFDGRWAATPDTGSLVWQDTCFGATYGVYPLAGALYSVSHAHDCSSIKGFPQTNPWTWHRALAETTAPVDTDPTNSCANCTSSNYGKPIPGSLNWFPTVNTGTYTGQSQGGWTVSGNSKYVVMGGEFTKINNTNQQGLVRFGVSSVAPNKVGPQVTATTTPSIVSLRSGTARVSWQTAWDMDNETLTYKVFRYGTAAPVYTTTALSRFYNQPNIGFTDTGLTAGATYKYFVQVSDPFNNSVNSGTASVTISASSGASSAYSTGVTADGATNYWRLGESSGPVAYDWAGYDDLSVNSGVSRNTPGAITGDADTASTFDGSTSGYAATGAPRPGPDVFSEEAWFKTTSTTGGKIVGFGNQNTGNSSNYDRHMYMDESGRVYFGVYNNGSYTINTGPGLNDGQWHQAVGTLSPSGMTFYVDGKKVGSNGGTTVGQPYNGYWRVGGDSPWAGAAYFAGSIDDVAIYPSALTLTQVHKHYTDSGRTLVGASAPSDAYGAAVWKDSPDTYWRVDETSGSTAQDSSGNSADGQYSGGQTLGVTSPVSGSTGTAVTFDGAGSTLASKNQIAGPSVYTEELWFKTTTNNGGKLIGFGDQQSGNSSSYDRHVYMETSGQLTFGAWTGQTNTTTSANAYNDGSWHYLVASQGSDGMNLYVDGQLVGTNAQTGQQPYNGYWRVGGDTAWNGTTWFDGTIDEVAVYSSVLSPARIAAHYAASPAGAPPANVAPTASFTSSTADL